MGVSGGKTGKGRSLSGGKGCGFSAFWELWNAQAQYYARECEC